MIAVLFRKLQKRKADLRPKTFASLAHLNKRGGAYPKSGAGVATVLMSTSACQGSSHMRPGLAGKHAPRSRKKARQVR